MHWDDFSVYDSVDQPIFVLVADADNRPVYQFLNADGLDRLGKSAKQVEGCPAYDIFSGRAAYSVYRRQCVAWSDAAPTVYEIALPLGNEMMWVRTKLNPVHDTQGRMTHMVGTSQDITLERNQMQANILSTAAAQEMEDLVCMAAHDLRSPISNLKTLAVLMRKDFVDHGDGKAQLIDMIDAISDKALAVVSNVMGQAMATNPASNDKAFDIGAMCDDIMVLLDPICAHSVTYPRHDVEAEFIVVHIILRNLIDNALKHSGVQTTRISIELTPMNAERLLFTVRDNGVGFARAALEKPAASQEQKGGGFGLTGVRRLVRSRGGQLTIAPSCEGKGAEVQIELPGRMVPTVYGVSKPRRVG